MKKISIIFLISFLILFTVLVKNSTKRIDDKIFATKENIRILENDFEKIKLEHDYLSSTEKLLEFQRLYFDDELVKKDIQNLKIINKTQDGIEVKQFKFTNER